MYLYWKLQTKAQKEPNKELFREKFGKKYDEHGVVTDYLTDKELDDLYSKIAYKNPLFSNIHSLTLAYVNEYKIHVLYQTGEEKDIILSFLNTLNDPHFSSHRLVNYDSGVLLPYFNIRASKNGISVKHKDLFYQGLRPWNLTGVSFRDFYKGAGDYNFNLREIAFVHGLDYDGIIDIQDENLATDEELLNSANVEIKLLINCHRASLGEDIITESKLKVEKVEKVKLEQEYCPMKDLTLTKDFSARIKKEIRNRCKGKRLTKKDKENLFTIIRAAYVETDFINATPDSKGVIGDKEDEIKEFIESI